MLYYVCFYCEYIHGSGVNCSMIMKLYSSPVQCSLMVTYIVFITHRYDQSVSQSANIDINCA